MYLPFTVKETSPGNKLIKLPEVPWIKNAQKDRTGKQTAKKENLGNNGPTHTFKPKGSNFHALFMLY